MDVQKTMPRRQPRSQQTLQDPEPLNELDSPTQASQPMAIAGGRGRLSQTQPIQNRQAKSFDESSYSNSPET